MSLDLTEPFDLLFYDRFEAYFVCRVHVLVSIVLHGLMLEAEFPQAAIAVVLIESTPN